MNDKSINFEDMNLIDRKRDIYLEALSVVELMKKGILKQYKKKLTGGRDNDSKKQEKR